MLPARCRLCELRLRHARRIPVCGECLNRITAAPEGCPRCGQFLAGQSTCLRCLAAPPPYEAAAAAAAYTGAARELILLLKFGGVLSLGEFWARRLETAVRERGWERDTDLVVPVPLGRRRRRERGYNQSAVMGRRLARRLGVACVERALARRRETDPQSGLPAPERDRNLAGAFAAEARRAAGRRVLLVDDVLTTGATARAASAALLAAGAAAVRVLTAARADLESFAEMPS